jgi:hypothetical protein
METKTAPDSAKSSTTSRYSYQEHYDLFESMHIGITQKNVGRIMESDPSPRTAF